MSTDVDNIWGELETEFESYTPAATPVVDTNQQVLRKMTVVDRFHRLIFSGWLYAAGMFGLTLTILALAGASVSGTGFNPAAASILPGLLALPLLAPLLANVRKPLWRYALLGPLLAGPFVLAQPTTLSLTMEVFSSGKSSTYMHLQFWNYYLEQYLSRPMWVMSAVGSIVLAWWLLRRQRALPWLEIPKISRWRVALAGTLAALPLSVILLAQPLGHYLSSIPGVEFVLKPPTEASDKSDKLWMPVFTKWRESLPEHSNLSTVESIRTTPKKTLREVESRALDLLSQKRYLERYRYSRVRKLFLSRVQSLNTPTRTFEALLSAEARHPEYGFGPDTPQALADYLQGAALNREELMVLQEALRTWRAEEANIPRRLDEATPEIFGYLLPTGAYKQKEIVAFGRLPLYSPGQLYLLWLFHSVPEKWRKVREELQNLEPSEIISAIDTLQSRERVDRTSLSLRYEIEQVAEDILRDNSGEARILTACKLYKLDHGTYPHRLAELSNYLISAPDPKMWKLESDGRMLTLISLRRQSHWRPLPKQRHLQ